MVAFFFPPPAAAPGITLTLVGQTDANNSTVSLPVGSVAGDIAIYLQAAWTAGSVGFGVPSGYTQMAEITDTIGGSGGGAQAGYKVLTGGETDIPTGTSAANPTTYALVYRPSRAIASTTYGVWNEVATPGDPPVQVADPSAAPAAAIVLAITTAGSGSYTFSTASPPFDDTPGRSNGSFFSRTGYKLYNSSPQSHSIDIGDPSNLNFLMSGYLAVS